MDNNQVKWYKSLIVKVNWLIILILIIFISILSWSINELTSEEISDQVKEVNLENAKSLKTNVNDFLDDTENIINLTASFIGHHLDNDQEIRELLEQVKEEYSVFKYIYFADTSGKMIIHPGVYLSSDYNPGERVWYKKAVKKDRLIWTDSYLDANDRYLMITVALPIKNEQGELLGVLAGDILLDQLSSTIASKKMGQTGYTYIANQSGEIIAHPNFELVKNKYNINKLLDYDQVYNEQIGSLNYKRDDEQILASFVSLDRLNSIIFSQINTEEAFLVRDKLKSLIFKISLIILFILILTVYLINKKYLLKPLHQLINNIIKVAKGDFEVQINSNREDEIGKLAQNFNYMTEEISAAYQQLEAYNQEITALNENLEYQAYHDPLTQLANRRNFREKLDSVLANKIEGSIILLDFDNFKEINDTFGHIYGDNLLKKFSQLLLNSFSDNVFAARYGGDEFLLLLEGINSSYEIKEYIYKLEALVARPFLIEESEFYLDFSLGISCFPKDSSDSYELITMADTAMYQAKESYNQDYLFYQPDMFNKIKNKQDIRKILRLALKNNGFKLKYQPQVNTKTGNVETLEALIRLKNYSISPAEFIPVAEESGLIIEISRWVTKRAIKDLAVLNKKKNKSLKISINFSVQQLNDLDYINFIEENMRANKVNFENLEIEITESLLIHQEQKAINYLNQLTDLGIKLALDDFGTGYSSLNYLTYISFSKVKLDKILIEEFLEYDNINTIDSLISLFHSMELPVVAEGVETEKQLAKLKTANCDYIQGYIFSKPLVFSQIIEKIDQL
ncbi:EAL domain-containing protein [Halanaerobium sp. ST460_2HS_T2]|jgi:diguanylate cyclase (GGDEF)-like protein|uniref:bifunctional diguanylate cyclase/phosphodiesterase n=1 Tax=Halanaerobium sp. ST460_2HS_T2 TaxID=2183914 RepID=UPI000DF25542|nr:EAL domain-containing protein [Halanaerobium sp. ST460_2HS_T2]RCW52999.1 diguanylate cyclase (GGDEF)-like protein [Halanaerobium sp. ST460_2HS_T2]